MIEIKKYKVDGYYWFDICTDEGIFKIQFCGNLDLYWGYKYRGSIKNIDSSKSFYITKENYFLYSLFDELYNDVKDYNIFVPNGVIDEERCIDSNKRLMESDLGNPKKVFNDGKIDWHSDDFDYDMGSNFVIEKLDDCYKLTFNKSKECTGMFMTYSVRIRNSGSRYGYFNMIFMRMYNKLREYDYEYDEEFHQIHIEEYLSGKVKIKRKETI